MTYLAVFDWNGTLFDDMVATHEGTNASLAFFNMPPITLEQEQELFTFPLIHFYEKAGVSVDNYLAHAREAGEIFNACYNQHKMTCGLAEGVIELLEWLKSYNVTCKILSNQIQKTLNEDVLRLGIEPYFETISGNEDPATIVSGTNKLSRLQDYMRENNFSPNKTFIIGDSHEEPTLARQLDILGISMAGGLLSPRRLEDYKKDYVINHMKDLPDILSKEWGLSIENYITK